MHIKRYELKVRMDEEARFYYSDAQEHKDGYWVRYEDVIDYIKWLDLQRDKNCVDEILAKCQQIEHTTGIDWMNYELTPPSTTDAKGSTSAL
jgi:hypothetical protein